MRYRLPEGCMSVSLDGVALDQTAKGVVEADASAAERLTPHGIVPIEGGTAGPASDDASKRGSGP